MMTRQLEWYTILWLRLIVLVSTDFQCICNYSKYGVPVYQSTTRTSVLIGVLDINDCKQYLYPASEQSMAFYAIMYRHQIGFVMEIHTKEINCKGTPPVKDIVTVSSLSSTGLTSRLTHASSTQATSTVKQPTSITTTKSPPSIGKGFTKKPITALSNISTHMSTLSLASLVTLPLNVRSTSTPTVLQVTNKGHVELCPSRIQKNHTQQPGELLAQLGKSCYQVVQSSVSWSHAESNCRRNGGHLLHIASQQEQDFIYNFLVKHHSHSVWLGLHDRNQEEHFEWTSGATLTYTNWKPGRQDNIHHNSEDCVYMIPSTGQWDDIQCGGDNAFSELIQGIRHAYICQYAISVGPSLIG